MARYRIVRDVLGGYEVQVKYWWFPFIWFQHGGLIGNTNISLKAAKDYINRINEVYYID